MFKWVVKWKTDVKEKAQKLTEQNIKMYSLKSNNKRINRKYNNESMIIDPISKSKNIFYDMNNCIHDLIVVHNEFKNRISWSDKEIDTFFECVQQYLKNIK